MPHSISGAFFMEKKSSEQLARELLQEGYKAVLSTHSKEVEGYPFGSVVPYCLDAQSRPVILISTIAQHTKNLKEDARASIIVLAQGEDIQAAARLTVVGDFEQIPEDESDGVAERYYRYFPDSRDYHKTHDFSFWRLNPKRLRFIGGFGRIHWQAPEGVLKASPFDYAREAGMVNHMNDDHADAILHYCAQANVAVPEGVTPVMTGLDSEGMHLRLGYQIVRIPFEKEVTTPLEARETLVAMARAGRG